MDKRGNAPLPPHLSRAPNNDNDNDNDSDNSNDDEDKYPATVINEHMTLTSEMFDKHHRCPGEHFGKPSLRERI